MSQPLLPPGGIQDALRGEPVGSRAAVLRLGFWGRAMGNRTGAALCAGMDLTVVGGAYLQLLSLKGFSLPVCEMGTELDDLFMYSLSIYCALKMPDTIPGAGTQAGNKSDSSPFSWRLLS